jgi:hypothetical protein
VRSVAGAHPALFAAPAGEEMMMDGQVIEMASFRLKQGVSEAALMQAAAVIQDEFLSGQPGFVRRELVREAEGKFADIILWTDLASAQAALAIAQTSAACGRYFALIEIDRADAGAGIKHLEVVARY